MADPNEPKDPSEEQGEEPTEEAAEIGEGVGGEDEEEETDEAGEEEEDAGADEPGTPLAQGGSQEQGATVHQHPSTAQYQANAEDFPVLVQKVFTARGTKATGDSYAGHLKRFLIWCATNNIDLATMPPDTAMKYLEEAYPNAVTRAQANIALRASFTVGEQYGVPFARQEIPKAQRPTRSKAKKPDQPAQQAQRPGLFDNEQPATPSPPPPPPQQQPRSESDPAQPAQPQRVSQPRATPGIPKTRTGVPSLASRIRISKRSDGTDGYAPGTIILVGMYDGTTLEGEGSIEEFIANRIRPAFGPFPGERATTYYVDRLDNLGNPIPNATISVPIMPPLTDPGATGPQHRQQAPFQAPVINSPASGASFDNFVSYLMRRQEEAEKKYENLLTQMQQQASKGGMDPTMFMLMAERMRPEPLDLEKAAEQWKRANPAEQVKWGRRKTDREQSPEEFLGSIPGTPLPIGGPRSAGASGGLGGLDPFEAAHAPAHDNVFAEILKQQGEMFREILRNQQPRGENPSNNPRELFEMFATFAKAMQPPAPPPNPFMEQLAQIALQNATKAPEPGRNVRTIIEELRELREAQEILGGVSDDKPLSFAEVFTAAIEHAPQIGEAIGNVLAQMPRAPTIPTPVPVPVNGAARVATTPPVRAPAASNQPVVPPAAAQQAFIALQTETDEQAIINHLFTILTEYHGAVDPWPRCQKLVLDQFTRATTPAEIRSLVTNLYVWSGAKRLMNDAVIDRITHTLVRHYSLIYASVTGGGQKGLGAEVTPITPTATEEPTPEAVERGSAAGRAGAASVHEEEEEGNGGGEIVYEEEERPPLFP